MKFNPIHTITFLTLVVMFFSACDKEKGPVGTGKYGIGVLITNEGPFTDGTGTISFYDPEKKAIENNVFQNVNKRPLGNIVQSLTVFDDKAFIVVNNAGKIEVADAGTFESIGVIEGLTSPRYFVGLNSSKGYVSDWAGNVKILDLNAMTSTGLIVTGSSPDLMLLNGTRLWVVNSAGWTSDSTITVIDTQTDNVIQTFVVGDNPAGIVKDAEGKIWVLCGGISDWQNPANNTNGVLVRINPSTFAIELRHELSGSDFGPRLAINGSGQQIYFSFLGTVYMFDSLGGATVQPIPFIAQFCYALAVDPDNGEVYVTDPFDYAQPGALLRYSSSGNILIDSLAVGIIPGNILFVK